MSETYLLDCGDIFLTLVNFPWLHCCDFSERFTLEFLNLILVSLPWLACGEFYCVDASLTWRLENYLDFTVENLIWLDWLWVKLPSLYFENFLVLFVVNPALLDTGEIYRVDTFLTWLWENFLYLTVVNLPWLANGEPSLSWLYQGKTLWFYCNETSLTWQQWRLLLVGCLFNLRW